MNEIAQLSKKIAAFREATGMPGFLAGIYRGGEQAVVAHGVANVATGTPMHENTGFLFGSITKIMTTTLVLQQVERGVLDLDTPVTAYLPEFRLAEPGAAEKIRVRHLVTHTSGIDADLFFPDAAGPNALKVYVERLGRECGALFEPGEYVSYSNGGMIVAGRLLEVVTGTPYHELLERDVFAPTGMTSSCTSAERAILRATAIGHFPAVTGEVRPTGMFTLPRTWGPAGGTPIGTIEDLLAFGRVHLGDGTAPSGARVLSTESVARMGSVTHDMGTPDSSPVGMGWLVRRLGGTTVLTMTGASPGGVAVLAVLPERDLVFAAYGNDARALELHDDILLWLAGQFGEVETPVYAPEPVDLRPYAGTYRSDQLRVDVRVVDGELEEQVTYEPADEAQERIFTGFVGGSFTAPPLRYVPIGKGLFAPAGMPLEGLPSHYLVSYHGETAYRCSGGRMTRRTPA
ncbi:serine hydrolase domain-containing protein [Amycolatopsis keratiniphila]|uniref:Serine hydrolase n=1 Tax=Amycolatopsis keratiniphila subsp. keratiniphila TaxID=227715 RepID=A0A1W2LYA6_9PSEU|nr:serine hydrolase domain-containing protein [Amycolatopsis keratiniphila]ONF72203.1 serine hydrolase [Amycolatopsis keratiniphila subsp. keratiniphila]